jgi:hypothetical protein
MLFAATCDNNTFHVSVLEKEDKSQVFEFVICTACKNAIPINMTPVFGPNKGD